MEKEQQQRHSAEKAAMLVSAELGTAQCGPVAVPIVAADAAEAIAIPTEIAIEPSIVAMMKESAPKMSKAQKRRVGKSPDRRMEMLGAKRRELVICHC